MPDGSRVSRRRLMAALARWEANLRRIGTRVDHEQLPGRVRVQILAIANAMARIIEREKQ